MQAEDVEAIRSLSLFSEAQDSTFTALIDASYLQRFPPGVTLIEQGAPADFIYVVLDGLVEMFATGAGRKTTIALLRPLSAFILAAVLSDQAHLQSARTLRDSQILLIPAKKLREAMAGDVAFMRAIVAELARTYRATVRDLKNQKLRSGPERLGAWLLRFHEALGGVDEFTLDVDKRTLAARLGMTPESLSRGFAALRSHGVASHGARIAIQREALSSFVQPDPMLDEREGSVW